MDCVVGHCQLHNASLRQSVARSFSSPKSPLSYGLLGALSLGVLEFALKRLTAVMVEPEENGNEKKAP